MLEVLPPLIAAYVIFVLMVLSAGRRPVARPRTSVWLGTRRRGIGRHLAATVSGGYAVFIAIVVIFHAWLGSEPGAIAGAFIEGSLLALGVLSLFVGAASPWRKGRRPG